MNLAHSQHPARVLTWGNKSLASCSRKELIQAVLYLTSQVADLNDRLMALSMPAENPQSGIIMGDEHAKKQEAVSQPSTTEQVPERAGSDAPTGKRGRSPG